MKKAFTLIEVNLAIMIMAGGILSILGLYGLGFRENRQSREDVAASAYADAVISPLVMALSSTNITWDVFKSLPSVPSDVGWEAYINQSTGIVDTDPDGMARSAFSTIMGKVGSKSGVNTSWPSTASGGLKAGLVIRHEEDSAVVRIAFRATRLPAELMAMPLFYTEVRWQGPTDKATEDN